MMMPIFIVSMLVHWMALCDKDPIDRQLYESDYQSCIVGDKSMLSVKNMKLVWIFILLMVFILASHIWMEDGVGL